MTRRAELMLTDPDRYFEETSKQAKETIRRERKQAMRNEFRYVLSIWDWMRHVCAHRWSA